MESFGERMTKLRKGAGLTRNNMAFLLEISEESVEYLETEYSEPNIDILLRLAQIFNVSESYVAMLTDEAEICEDSSVKEIYVVNHFDSNRPVLKRDIVDSVYMAKKDLHGKEYIAYISDDDAMVRARICKGDTLIIRKQNWASNSDVVVAVFNDKEIVRRYYKKGSIITLFPESDDPMFQVIETDVNKGDLSIMGVVKEIRVKNP